MVDNSGGGQEVELNLAPIIDCFTVLITYLLVTASFLTFASVDVAISATNPTKDSTPPPIEETHPLVMTLDLAMDNEILLKVSGGDLKAPYEVKIPPVGNVWNEVALGKNLVDITTRWAKLKDVSVSAAPDVKYRELVNVINATQKTLPKIYISAG